MNGRLYDPILGRMLSPDPYVQMPDFSQNFNRYSYCLNNPLIYADPNGEWIQYVVAIVVGGVLNVVDNWNDISSKDDFWSSLGTGVLYFLAGGANGVMSLYGPAGTIIGGGIENGANEWIKNGYSDEVWNKVTEGAISSAITYGISHFVSKGAEKILKKVIPNRKLLEKVISRSFAGGVAGFTAGMLTSMWFEEKSPKDAFKDGMSGFFAGLINGAVAGIFDYYEPFKDVKPKKGPLGMICFENLDPPGYHIYDLYKNSSSGYYKGNANKGYLAINSLIQILIELTNIQLGSIGAPINNQSPND